MGIINDSILTLITVLHLIVILFILIAPFSNSNYLLTLHIIIIPFIMLHWWLNNNTCSLTMAEKFIRQQAYGDIPNMDECFTYKFISPIYDFNKNYESYSTFSYLALGTLWGISVYNITYKINDGKIKNINDLLKP